MLRFGKGDDASDGEPTDTVAGMLADFEQRRRGYELQILRI